MANNNIKIDIDVRGKGLLEAIKSTDSLEKNMRRLSDTYGRGGASYQQYYRAVQKLATANGKSTKELLNHGKALRADTKAAKAYKDMLKQADTMNRAFDQGIKQQAQSLHRLKMATDASYAATNKLQAAKRVLKEEVKQGRMTAEQYVASMRKVVQANKAASISAGQMGRRMSRSGVMVQQAGYQIGDFIVQAQSGQNVMVAFGQQATQMAGTLTMLGGKFIGIGTVLGIAIPLATAFGAALMRTAGSSRSLVDTLKDVEAANDKLEGFGSVFGSRLIGDIEAVRNKFGEFTADIYEFDIKQLQKKIKGAFSSGFFSESFAESFPSTSLVDVKREATDLGLRELGVGNSPISDTRASEVLFIQEQLLKLTDANIYSQKDLSDTFNEVYDSLKKSGKLSEQGLKTLRGYGKEWGVFEESVGKSLKSVGKHHDSHVEALQKYRGLVSKTRKDQQDQIDLALRTLRLGEDHVDVVRHRAKIEGQSLGFSGEELKNYVAQALVLNDITNRMREKEAAAKAVEEAFKKTQASLKTLVGQSSNLDVEIAKAKAQIEALKNNTDVATAAYIAGERAKITATYETTKALAIQNGEMIALAENALAYAEAMGKLDILEGLRESLAGMKGDAKASKSNPLLDLQKRIALDTKLLGVSREQAQVERAIANSKIKYSPKEIANTVKELEAYNLKLDKMKETQALYGTMQSSLESGFMAMVDGTKSVEDAFKDMAKQVISELYRVLVVQRMVGNFESGTGIMGMIGGIFGGAPTSSIRPQMRPSSFDGGGYTGSGPRSGGMDGRGGYMAMLHPRETVIDHTKAGSAGGGQGVTVVNNFNFQANGDDSVKRIIAQAAPSIANMAKQSVIDARRRGGVMKNTFG